MHSPTRTVLDEPGSAPPSTSVFEAPARTEAAPEPWPDAEPSQDISKLQSQLKNGANWFYWIAALSLVNSLIVLFNGEWSFVVGLGTTQIIDATAVAVAGEAGSGVPTAVALLLDAGVAGFFVLFGLLANRFSKGAFLTGMILYALDGLIFLPFGDWLSLGFHVFALMGILGGYRASQKLKGLSAPAAA